MLQTGKPRKRLSFFWACILVSVFCLLTGRGLFDFGDAEADPLDRPVEVAQVDPGDATEHGHDTPASDPTGDAHDDETGDSHGEDHGTEGAEEHGEAAAHGGGHTDPVAPVLLWLLIILVCAKLGGDLFDRMGQPSVLGELLAGVAVGNVLFFFGYDFMIVFREGSTALDAAHAISAGGDPHTIFTAAFNDPDVVATFMAMFNDGSFLGHANLAGILDIFSRVGVIILLFLVGLETNFSDMVKVGITSLLVGVVGVVVPFGLGWLVGIVMLPDASTYVHLFIGATLCATSVGITARVFKDLGKLQTQEAKIILGAAVIDDVLGLIILAVTQGIIVAADTGGGDVNMSLEILKIVGLSFLFLGGALVIGINGTPFFTRVVAKMRVPGMKLIYSLSFAFLLSWGADAMGLATIVGAFAAGLVLDEVHFRGFTGTHHSLEELIEPIAIFLVPVFFVMMGLQVKLETFADVSILGLAAGITIAAVIGKQVCGLVVRDPAISKTSIGFGMIPRGEVGLIFAAIGKQLTFQGQPVIDSGTFSAIVIMVILTTLCTPPLLKWSMASTGDKPAEPDPAPDH